MRTRYVSSAQALRRAKRLKAFADRLYDLEDYSETATEALETAMQASLAMEEARYWLMISKE